MNFGLLRLIQIPQKLNTPSFDVDATYVIYSFDKNKSYFAKKSDNCRLGKKLLLFGSRFRMSIWITRNHCSITVTRVRDLIEIVRVYRQIFKSCCHLFDFED
jgi:hypothetical protein